MGYICREAARAFIMKLTIQCPSCDARLKIKQELLGKRVDCPACGKPIDLKRRRPRSPDNRVSGVGRPEELVVTPTTDDGDEPDTYGLKRPRPATAAPGPLPPRAPASSGNTLQPVASTPRKQDRKPKPKKQASSWQRPEESSTAKGRWLLYAVLFATMLPLLYSNFVERNLTDRFEESITENLEVLEELSDEATDEELIAALPGGKIKGAHLSRQTWVHWIYAAVSLTAFIGLYMALFRNVDSGKGLMLGSALFTATFGIFLLLAFQWLAAYSGGMRIWPRGIIGLLFLVVRLIGFSYSAALTPGNGFIESMLGFTFGVGLCEELCKAIPVIWFLRESRNATWRTACLVGLASGVGFGVSEGITYSADYYNGLYGIDIYVVRFVSCVALHSAWAGAAAVLMYFNQSYLPGNADGWGDILIGIGIYLGVPILLHGLYDTLLKQHYELGALATAVATVGWLIFIVERLHDD